MIPPDSSLDLPPEDLRALAEGSARLVEEYFQSLRARPVFPRVAAGDILRRLGGDLPQEGAPLEDILADCRAISDASRHNGHPRFFGYVASPSTPPGAYADLIASALNANVTSWRSAPAAVEVEKIVLRWLGDWTGFGSGQGLLTSGGSLANTLALFMALRRVAGPAVARRGLRGEDPLTLYASEEAHMSIPKAADFLGLGRDQVRLIPCDARYRIDLEELRRRLETDLNAGLRPFCVVGNAGSVKTGAVDPLEGLADMAREFGLWFHVDGAYGAPGALDESKRALFAGLERADSLSLDPHKWLFAPVDAGCLLLRDEGAALHAFGESAGDYVRVQGFEDEEAFAFWDRGPELSRRFRALKIWFALRYYGARRLAAAIRACNALALTMARRVEEDPDFELLAPVELSICCFRYRPAGMAPERLDSLNEAILRVVQRGGEAYVSNAEVAGRFALRACVVNFRTTEGDIDRTLEIIRAAGGGLSQAASGAAG